MQSSLLWEGKSGEVFTIIFVHCHTSKLLL